MEFTDTFTHPIFKNFTQTELDYLFQSAKTLVFKKGDVLIQEGDVGHEIYVVLEGKVDVNKKGCFINSIKAVSCNSRSLVISDTGRGMPAGHARGRTRVRLSSDEASSRGSRARLRASG